MKFSKLLMEGSLRSRYNKLADAVDVRDEDNENPNWSDLPDEALEEVQRRLPSIDHLRFGGVCRTWRSSRAVYNEHRLRCPQAAPPPQLPWILVDYLSAWPPTCTRTFLCLSDQKKYKLRLRDLCFDKCIGSTAGGWLVMRNHGVMSRALHYLFNPFTKALIWLPENLTASTVSVAFSSDPSDPRGSAVIVPHHQSACSLLYKRSGSDRWCSYMLDGDDRMLQQVVAVGKKFYALTTLRKFVEIDLEAEPVSIVRHDSSSLRLWRRRSDEHIYLVESSGDLLVIVQYCSRITRYHFHPDYDIYKLSSGGSALEDLRSRVPRGRLLFLAPNGSFSMPVAESGLRGEGKIYWGTNHLEMADRTKHFCFSCAFQADCFWHLPVWVQPQLFYEERKDLEGRKFLTCRNLMRWALFALMCFMMLILPFLPIFW